MLNIPGRAVGFGNFTRVAQMALLSLQIKQFLFMWSCLRNVRCFEDSTALAAAPPNCTKKKKPTKTNQNKNIDRCLPGACFRLTLAVSGGSLFHVLIKHIDLGPSNWEDKDLDFWKRIGQWFLLFLTPWLGGEEILSGERNKWMSFYPQAYLLWPGLTLICRASRVLMRSAS